jgi:2-polyprenyl-3-methyl-5-hydroxy-6-metoxy-1,4-benzoquinol methylase
MASVKDHYDRHLAPIYTWMRGGAEAPRRQFAEFLRAHSLAPSHPDATALDLGAGSGFQALPLAEAGYAVTAVDLSETLLAELARDATAAHLTVQTAFGDMCDITSHTTQRAPDLIVCAGDTLTHLASLDQVARLLSDSAAALAPGGHLILSFRDYSPPRTGPDRFIPVRSDAHRIFTCFLEFGPTHLTVHDLLHTRDSSASDWSMTVSTYEKVRIAPGWVRAQLEDAGLTLIHDELTAGLATFIARRPSALGA